MKNIKLLLVLPALLILSLTAVRAQKKTDSLPKIRFEAKCKPESPKKTLIIVNDTCYFLIAHKSNSPFGMGIRMQDYGAANLFKMRAVPTEGEEGKALLRHIPKEYNNQIGPHILVVNDAE